MVKIPKWFQKWYSLYGSMDDYLPPGYESRGLRIAWRAYRKGKKDYQVKPRVSDNLEYYSD